jgi:serine/threonine protein kinase
MVIIWNFVICKFSVQKDPHKRPSARDLLTHPFIMRYNEADADLIFWLKDYQEL